MQAIDLKLLRLRQVCELTGLSRSSVYRLIAESAFPKPISLSARAVAWRVVDLHAWLEAPERKWGSNSRWN